MTTHMMKLTPSDDTARSSRSLVDHFTLISPKLNQSSTRFLLKQRPYLILLQSLMAY